jgi:hypothetical protein
MSLYREPGRRGRLTVILAAVAAIVLLAIGFVIGRATAPEPSLRSQLAGLRDDVEPAADALELVAIHYESSSEAARAQLDRAEELYADVEDRLAIVNSAGAAEASKRIAALADLVAAGASPQEVESAAVQAEEAVRGAIPDV